MTMTRITPSRNKREGVYQGHCAAKHWRSLRHWLHFITYMLPGYQRAPAGIRHRTLARLARQLDAIRVIRDDEDNEYALRVVRYAMDVLPDIPAMPLREEFLRVVELISDWEIAKMGLVQ